MHTIGELLEAEMMRRNIERPDRLASGESVEVGHVVLDHETPSAPEVRRRVAEASDLQLLGAKIPNRVEHQVHEGRIGSNLGVSHVANGEADALGAVLLSELGQHRL